MVELRQEDPNAGDGAAVLSCVPEQRPLIEKYFKTSSYMAVPARATLLSALVFVPYVILVPGVTNSLR
jgi:hypothetical protein